MRMLAFSLALLASGPCVAHAFLQSATPAVGSTVKPAPTRVQLEWTQDVEPAFTTITVQDASGARVDTGQMQVLSGADLAIGLKPLHSGTYQVTWHATSVDTHKTEGQFKFSVAQ